MSGLVQLQRFICAILICCLGVMAFPRVVAAVPPARVRSLPVSVSGAPRTLVTLVVPVPSALAEQDVVHYQVVLSGAVDVLGRLEGNLSVASGQRTVMLTLRVPASALVGLLDVADVVFASGDGASIVVPIILRVPGVYAVRVTGVRELAAISPGDRIELEYRVQNLGNDTERLRVELRAPTDWAVRVESGQDVVVQPYGSESVVLRLRVPPTPSSGTYMLGVRLARRGDADTLPAATVTTMLRLTDRAPRAEVLAFHPFIGSATAADGTAIATGLRVAGPIGENVRIDASFSPAPVGDGLSLIGLNGVGVAQIPLNVSLSAPSWRAQVGFAQSALPELAGVGFAGRGGSATIRRGMTEFHLVGALPAAEGGRRGQLVGFSTWTASRFGRVGVAVSSLSEQSRSAVTQNRELTALTAQWDARGIAENLDVALGLGVRRHSLGTGIGFSFAGERRYDRGSMRIGATVTPGGSAAFASAARRLDASIRHQLSARWDGDVAVSNVDDVGPVFGASRLTGYAIGLRTVVLPGLGLGARVGEERASLARLGEVSGGLETRQRFIAPNVAWEFQDWRLSVDGRSTLIERRTQLFSGALADRQSLQHSAGFTASRSTTKFGSLSLGSTYVVSGAGLGLPEGTLTAQAMWNDWPVIVGEQVFRLTQDLRLLRTNLVGPQVGYRAAATTTLRGFEVASSLERSPFLTDSRGRPAWMFGLRVSVTSQLLTSDRLQTSGEVFRDLNGNGQRDPGEPGVAGVVLTHDRSRFVSNRAGEYRVPQSVRGRLRVDPTSIPAGLLLHPRSLADTAERRDVALVPVGALEVVLVQELDEGGRVPAGDLTRADLWLRDADGFEWVGRHVGSGRFLFEDVPVGAYVLRSSFARTGEVLRTDDLPVTVLMGARTEVRVPVRGRNVRIITPPSQGRGTIGPRNGRSLRNSR